MGKSARILVVDDDESIRRMLRICLESAGYQVTTAASGELGVSAARQAPPAIAFVDLRLGGMDGIAVTRALAQEVPGAAVVLVTAHATIDNAVDAMRAGAADYLPKPFTPAQVLHVVDKCLDNASVRAELDELKRSSRGIRLRFESKNAAVKSMLATVRRVAPTDATVLLLGETGTGKGVLARYLHGLSPRALQPFVTVNCAVITPGLVENELFGHSRGAFTGADRARIGHVEAAGSGTLFLDEVGDLPQESQGKLLRLLEEQEYVRIGDVLPRRSEARLVVATHRDLKASVEKGSFREDLYYRLNVMAIRVPALRERREDIPDLAADIVRDFGEQHHRGDIALAPETALALANYAWPGNVRELVNVLERAVILCTGKELTPELLPDDVRVSGDAVIPDDPMGESLEAAERRQIAAALARHPTLEAAARALRIDVSTLYRKRLRFGIK